VGGFSPVLAPTHPKIKKYKKARFLFYRLKKQTFPYTRLVLNYSAQTPNLLWSVTQRGATVAEMDMLSTILGEIFSRAFINPLQKI
jgi:hypothetical protein